MMSCYSNSFQHSQCMSTSAACHCQHLPHFLDWHTIITRINSTRFYSPRFNSLPQTPLLPQLIAPLLVPYFHLSFSCLLLVNIAALPHRSLHTIPYLFTPLDLNVFPSLAHSAHHNTASSTHSHHHLTSFVHSTSLILSFMHFSSLNFFQFSLVKIQFIFFHIQLSSNLSLFLLFLYMLTLLFSFSLPPSHSLSFLSYYFTLTFFWPLTNFVFSSHISAFPIFLNAHHFLF